MDPGMFFVLGRRREGPTPGHTIRAVVRYNQECVPKSDSCSRPGSMRVPLERIGIVPGVDFDVIGGVEAVATDAAAMGRAVYR